MARRKKLSKPIKKMNSKMRTKSLVLFSCIILCFGAIVGNTIYTGRTKGEEYTKKLLALRKTDTKTIPYQRGNIIDCNGSILATSMAVYDLVLDVTMMEEVNFGPTAKVLAECFEDLDEEKLIKYMENNRNSRYYVLERSKPYAEYKEFLEKEETAEFFDAEGKPIVNPVRGCWLDVKYVRKYPFNDLASSVIGFASAGNAGTVGLEAYYNSTLNGVDGRRYGFVNSDDIFQATAISPQNGNNLVLTIDANVQMIVESKLREFYEIYTDNWRVGGGFENCGLIIENPKTGEILAMADYPTFDLNDPKNLEPFFTEEQIAAMTDEQVRDFRDGLWQNFCVNANYEPGSIQKPLTVACGFETDTLKEGMTFTCDGFEMFEGHPTPIKCVNTSGHGVEDIRKTLMDSCNDAIMQMTYEIGKEKFAYYQNIFGFGLKTGIDLPGEPSLASLQYKVGEMSSVDLATNAFGQNYNCTMIQMISAISSLVNGGDFYQPHVVKKIVDEDGNTVSTVVPTLVKQTVSETTSEILKDYMTSVVEEGTGSFAKVDGYSMGGKTGTAEKRPRSKKNYVVSFMGFTPADDPEIVIYCVIDTPNVEDQAHSSFAQNVVREVMKELYPYLNIYPDEEKTGVNEEYDITGNVPPTYELGYIPEDPEETLQPAEQPEEAEDDLGLGEDPGPGDGNAEDEEEGQ